MTAGSLLDLLTAFHRDKLALRQRHVAVARVVSSYAFNNTYQYIICRDDLHLQWIEAALAGLDGLPATVDEPGIAAPGRRESVTPLVEEDARQAAAFVETWRPKVAAVSHARHRNMMGVVLGETLEHRRFFDQMIGGREDLLGRRANWPGSPGTGDGVMAVRWVE